MSWTPVPECGTGLVGGWPQRTREVIEIPVAPVEVTEHVFVTRVCPVCERRRTPKTDLGGGVIGRGRLGANLVSLIAGPAGKRAGCPFGPSNGIWRPSTSCA